MIKNERQYRITRAQAEGFASTLANLKQNPSAAHPLIAKAQEDAIRSQLADLQDQLQEYESLKAGNFEPVQLNFISQLPDVLIKARIARGLSQKDLAEKIHVKEQQIQRYEATDYASASLARIREVASVLYETRSDKEKETLPRAP